MHALKLFQLLNTSVKTTACFTVSIWYGNVSMLGPLSNLKISATARSEKVPDFYSANGSFR